MKALVCRQLGNPTVPIGSQEGPLALEPNYPLPSKLKDRFVRIKVAAASLNFADALQIMGKYQERPPLPFIPGSEVSGVIMEVGAAVTEVKAGDRVCAVIGSGGFAEEAVCDASAVFPLPDGCDLMAAAGLPVAFGTAHVGLIHRAGLQAGQVLLVLGAAGGVGLAAVQIGKLCGAVVIAAARGEKKAALLRTLGADCVIDTGSSQSLRDAVKAFLSSRKLKGIDVLFDPVGGTQFKESLKLLKWGAQLVIIGFASGEIPNIAANVALVKNLTIHGVYWGSYLTHRPAVLRDSLRTLLAWLADGSISIHVSHQFNLSQADQAFKALLGRKVMGKIIITPSNGVDGLSGGSSSSRSRL